LGDKLVESGDALFDGVSWQDGLHRSSLKKVIKGVVSAEIQPPGRPS